MLGADEQQSFPMTPFSKPIVQVDRVSKSADKNYALKVKSVNERTLSRAFTYANSFRSIKPFRLCNLPLQQGQDFGNDRLKEFSHGMPDVT
jgi:hypothetical protein